MNQDDKSQLLRTLEACIEMFGCEFRRWADDWFWQESDIVGVLLARLWQEPAFLHHFSNSLGDGTVPLVHTEKKLGTGQGKVRADFYLLDPTSAADLVRQRAYSPGFGNITPLAAIQVEGPDVAKLQKECVKAIDRLSNSKETRGQPYLLVFAQVTVLEKGKAPPRKYIKEYKTLLDSLKKKQEGDWKDLKLKIYCVPAYSVVARPDPQISPEWLLPAASDGEHNAGSPETARPHPSTATKNERTRSMSAAKKTLCDQEVGTRDGNQVLVESKRTDYGCVQLWKSDSGKFGVVRVVDNEYVTVKSGVRYTEEKARAIFINTD